MFSSRGKHSMKHFSRNGDFLLSQASKSNAAQPLPMSQFARPQELLMENLEKRLGIRANSNNVYLLANALFGWCS